MTEYEYISAISMLRTEARDSVMMFFTVWSAYLVAIYLVGHKLSLANSASLTALYTFFIVMPTRGVVTNFNEIIGMYQRYFAEFPDATRPISGGVSGTYLLISVLFLAWLVSVIFLIQRRNQNDPNENIPGTTGI